MQKGFTNTLRESLFRGSWVTILVRNSAKTEEKKIGIRERVGERKERDSWLPTFCLCLHESKHGIGVPEEEVAGQALVSGNQTGMGRDGIQRVDLLEHLSQQGHKVVGSGNHLGFLPRRKTRERSE